jgi:hypothetical protein
MKLPAFAARPLLLGSLVALTTLVTSEAVAIDPSAVEVRTTAVKGSDMPRITAKAVLSLPPEKIWAIISDCSKYKGRMPRVAARKEGRQHAYV